MKKFFSALILITMLHFSSVINVMSQRFLAIYKNNGSRELFYQGEEIKIKLTGEDAFTSRTIFSVTDSGFVTDGRNFVNLNDVTHVKVYSKKQKRVIKALLLYGGLMVPAVSGVNGLINKTSPVFSTWSLIYGGASLATYGTLMAIDHSGKTYKIAPSRPLKVIILDMNAPN